MAEVEGATCDENGERVQCDDYSPTLGVAISGGGVRAAFFAIGALLYLFHSGLNKHVRLIQSVSGGSILNMVLAMNCDFQDEKRASFERLMSTMCKRLSSKGVFFFKEIRVPLLVFLLLVEAVLAVLMAPFSPVNYLHKHASLWLWATCWSSAAILAPIFTILMVRKPAQIFAYKLFLVHLYRASNASGRPPRLLKDLPESKVTHVLCSTELASGRPLTITMHALCSSSFGVSRRRGKMSIAQALYASAAFPAVFPPLRVKSEDLDFSGGPKDEPPAWLYLADGGVFNNLATEGLEAIVTSAEDKYLVEPVEGVVPVVQRNIVINASAPPCTRRLGIFKLPRTISVMHVSTVRPRIERLMEQESLGDGPIVIDIAESPIELAQRIALGETQLQNRRNQRRHGVQGPINTPFAKRAEESLASLRRRLTDAEWKERANDAARTKTVLSAIGRRTAIRLVSLGFINAAVACNAHLETQGIELVPPQAWFHSLVDGNMAHGVVRKSPDGDA